MKPIYYTFLAAALTTISCKNNAEETSQADPRLITPFTQQTATTLQTQSNQQAAPQQHNLFQGQGNTTATSSAMATNINPAHGQPNHRCDIAVGAPLNAGTTGAVTTQSNPAQVQPQVQTITQSVAGKTVTPKGINPPHGEKGHRCDIAVGDPLNSKPTTTTTAAPVTTSGEVTSNFTVEPPIPSLLSTSSTNAETAAGMNPAHGQPGHRCDVSVGAPLPKS